jgi:uncharacterized damage-inducible protein DinB
LQAITSIGRGQVTMTVSQLRSDLQESREDLFEAIHGLAEEQFRFSPDGESWCIATHLAHLLRIERVFVERARRALTNDEPRVASTRASNDDDPGPAQKLAVPQIVHGMQATRRDLDRLLAGCEERALERGIIHERLGRMTVSAMAEKIAGHEREHAAAVRRLARQAPASARVIIPLSGRS